MDSSYIAENRIEESQPEKERLSPVLSQGRKLSDDEILEKLNSFGIKINKKILNKLSRKFISVEELSKWLFQKHNLQNEHTTDMELKRVWIWLTVLWERWFPKRINFEMIDDKMAYGYDELSDRNDDSGCEILIEAWHNIVKLMKKRRIQSIAEFDGEFKGSYFVFNMINDLEGELGTAANIDNIYCKKRISFCKEFLKKFSEEDSLTTENFKRAIAESYFELGKHKKTEKLYKNWLKRDPEWGWGWIGWSDCFWRVVGDTFDSEKAENILKHGLAIKDVRDRIDLLERLRDFYAEAGSFTKSEEIQKEMNALADADGDRDYIEAPQKIIPRTHKKFPRNKPCPCGSGKKYKKCCGKL